MALNKKIICSILLCSTLQSFGQLIQEHQWKERVLLIITNDEYGATYKKQLQEFEGAVSDFKERKLIIYRITPKFYRTGLSQTKKITSVKPYKNYKKTQASLEIILIGLDGGLKLSKSRVVTKKELFALIDSMPMRKNEIKNKG